MQQASTYRLFLVASIVVRTYFTFQASYIHPDEHFQGPEPIVDTIFGWASHKTWEFTVDTPPRSQFAMWLIFGVPLSLLRIILGPDADPMAVYFCLRFVFTLASWVLCDMFIDRLALSRKNSVKSLFFMSTSYVSWVYQSHFFTNSVETVLVLWSLALIQDISATVIRTGASKTRFRECILLGFLLALGVFNRPSFGAYMLIPCLTLVRPLLTRKFNAMVIALAALITAYGAIAFDTWVYGSDSYVVAPLNNVLYNTKASNLAQHGIHARWTHLLASIPQLLGPALLYFPTGIVNMKMLPFKAAVSGFVILSLIPHQEARFLVPIVPLFCLFISPDEYSPKIRKCLVFFWILFNAVLAILMGIFHQGGVVPAQHAIGQYLKSMSEPLSSSSSSLPNHLDIIPSTVIYWKTYSPPVWIMGLPMGSVSYTQEWDAALSTPVNLVDMMGCPEPEITTIIQQSLEQNRQTILVAPNSILSTYSVPGTSATLLYATKKHISMESFDWTHPKLGLSAWKFVNSSIASLN